MTLSLSSAFCIGGLVLNTTWAFLLASIPSQANVEEPLPPTVEFNRDIRPILADNCFQCHGPDKAKRKAHLRLDTEAGAVADLDGRHAIVPGKPDESELIRRITAIDEQERMPPVRSGRRLDQGRIDLLRRWIEQGARWEKHWALLPPRTPLPPAVKAGGWVRNGIDNFILDRLERAGMALSQEAEKAALLRRVSLDLTGLPPTLAELDAFLADTSPDAYVKVVDRLLGSPRFGERMAIRWLEAARYADTNGYQSDGERFMWRWRDWVIDAYNRNLPFDRFTIEQLAGDLLPGATLDQRIATGFNRNHRGNAEGGIIPEEYAVEYVVDRVETTATVWLGLTMGCARCHDHKFDPITQKEFYQVFAYFNNVPEKGKAVKYGNSPPMIQAPTPRQQEQLRDVEKQLAAATNGFQDLEPQLTAAQDQWEQSLPGSPPVLWSIEDGLTAYYPLDGDTINSCASSQSGKFHEGQPAFASGKLGQAADFNGRRFIDAGDVANFGFYDKFSCAAWIYPRKDGTILSRMTDVAQAEGYGLGIVSGKVQVNLVKRWLDDAIRVETKERLAPNCWHHVLMTYDGSRVADGVRVYVDGRRAKMKVLLDDLNQSFQSPEPLRIGAGQGPENRFQGLIDEVRIHRRALTADEAEILATPGTINAIARTPDRQRTSGQRRKIRAYFLDKHAADSIQQAYGRVRSLRTQHGQLAEQIPTTMVMEEMATPRPTHVLIRGQYDKPGESVVPAVPRCLPSLPDGVTNNRLGFAQWLVDPGNPLTARVAVNRYWQMYFGNGLVKTVDDFGCQGEWPVHPELLDWLATEFVRSGWDVKAMQRLIVTSATYRQSSRVTPELRSQDPENRLLARGPRLRLSAEMVRDQALAMSGLLVECVGGPSVKPYQPAGLWKELTGAEEYEQDHGANLYRRSLYTFWKRTVAPPAMMTFDAAGRETCVVRQMRTNTPLQALNLMNDVTYVEAARVLAERLMKDGGMTPEERLTLAFRLATARRPRPAELEVLVRGFHDHLGRFRAHLDAARQLVQLGEFPRDDNLDVTELAAYTAVSGLILNLDEVITKE
jgi:hypothetical protein